MKFHSYSEVFPLLSDSDLTELADDIKAFGLREPIWLYEGQILDGRNRFLACQKSKTKPTYRKFKGADEGALALVISANIKRRQLSDAQRAMAAARIATLRQGRPSENGSRDPFITQGDAADKMDVSPSSIKRAKRVIDKGSKALQGAVESGDVPLRRAASVLDLPKSEQLAAARNGGQTSHSVSHDQSTDFRIEDYNAAEDEGAIERCEQDWKDRVDKAMHADDKLAEALNQLKIQAGLLSAANGARDHYQRQAGEATRLLKVAQRKIAALEKKIAGIQGTGLPEEKAPAVQ